jgi:DNA repair exonuclease SbcCD ATPase subunit
MIKLKNITMKNFMSVGNVTQAVILNEDPISLILGENRDLGGSGNRNGVGKSTIINAITYALYGAALTKIKLPNLINKTNGKKMMVTLEFSSGGVEYRIERGRGPEVFKLFVNGVDHFDNNAQGDSRLTQKDVEATLGMDKVLFSNIVALNTFTEPFLSMSAAKQREMMELLLGMTKLSEKALSLKEEIKSSKDDLKEEEFRIKGINDSNAVITRNIESAEAKLNSWNTKHDDTISAQAADLLSLDSLDIEAELEKHSQIDKLAESEAERSLISTNISTLKKEVQNVNREIDQCKKDIHRSNDVKSASLKNAEDQLHNAEAHRVTRDGIEGKRADLKSRLADLVEAAANVEHSSECPTCKQHVEGDQHEELISEALKRVEKCRRDISQCDVEEETLDLQIVKCGELAETYRKDGEDCDKYISECKQNITQLESTIADLETGIRSLEIDLKAIPIVEKPTTFYKTISQAYEHKTKIDVKARDLENEIAKVNPYIEQVDVLRESLQDIKYDEIEKLTVLREHQDFLLKLLTNKDSFIRKKIIDQNLSFLNERLRHYLGSIGLPHSVIFNPNLDVSISEFGRDLDFDNLSRGEKTRLILSLSWAFRDIYESMNGSINLLFIDELLDSGLDASGTEATLSALKVMAHEQNKNVMLISHREELVGKVDNIITVCKENGFTRIETSEL